MDQVLEKQRKLLNMIVRGGCSPIVSVIRYNLVTQSHS
jgi:hypothetical protein